MVHVLAIHLQNVSRLRLIRPLHHHDGVLDVSVRRALRERLDAVPPLLGIAKASVGPSPTERLLMLL